MVRPLCQQHIGRTTRGSAHVAARRQGFRAGPGVAQHFAAAAYSSWA